MNNKRNVAKMVLTNAEGREKKKERKCVKMKLNHKLEALAQGLHSRDLKV
jgi:hypothetical protein